MPDVDIQKLEIAGETIRPGTRKRIEISCARLHDYTEMVIPVEVVRGRRPGPTLFVSAAIHGDEINGVEIIKRLLARKVVNRKTLCGTLIAVPIVNVFGFNSHSRYLPDRRDLNRCFPGSENGSLASQIAHVFMTEIVSKSTHGIDLHTGAIHRSNLPQIRAHLDNDETTALARAFGVPVVLNSSIRDGSLRQSAQEKGIPMLLFEGGEALRFDEKVIRTGLRGVLNVMGEIGMLAQRRLMALGQEKEVFIARSSHWVRAPHSGALRIRRGLGARVDKGELLGLLSDPYGGSSVRVCANKEGIIVGITMIPLVNQGDALFHIATFDDTGAVEEYVEEWEER